MRKKKLEKNIGILRDYIKEIKVNLEELYNDSNTADDVSTINTAVYTLSKLSDKLESGAIMYKQGRIEHETMVHDTGELARLIANVQGITSNRFDNYKVVRRRDDFYFNRKKRWKNLLIHFIFGVKGCVLHCPHCNSMNVWFSASRIDGNKESYDVTCRECGATGEVTEVWRD